MDRERLAVKAAKAFARWVDVPLAEDAPGAMNPTGKDRFVSSVEATEADEGLEAARLAFNRWKDVDPFPAINSALLNTADIDDYMRATSMVFPYNPAKRKTASYAIRVGMEIAFWDPATPNTPPIRRLNDGDRITIPSNSLIYVRTRERFLLPNYMAVRFNLHIDLVHKGLLLGTGPLVDPGFEGHLMVPLHNLTSNDYVLAVGDDFIWAEFTKTSLTENWIREVPERPQRSGELKPFPKRKANQSIAEYIAKATLGHLELQPGLSHATLQNSIPDAIARASKTADNAKASAAKAKRAAATIRNVGVLALLGAAIGLGSILIANNSALQTTLTIVRGSNGDIQKQNDRIKNLEVALEQIRQREAHLRNRDEALSKTARARSRRQGASE